MLATLARSTAEITGAAQALVVMDRSLAWSACLLDTELTALLMSQRALILFRGGRLGDAESAFGDVLARMPGFGIDVLRVLLNRGALYVETGELDRARARSRPEPRRSPERSNTGCSNMWRSTISDAWSSRPAICPRPCG